MICQMCHDSSLEQMVVYIQHMYINPDIGTLQTDFLFIANLPPHRLSDRPLSLTKKCINSSFDEPYFDWNFKGKNIYPAHFFFQAYFCRLTKKIVQYATIMYRMFILTNLFLYIAVTMPMEQKKCCSWNIKTHYLRFKHFIITITDDPSPC
jgi:hypothetical protein